MRLSRHAFPLVTPSSFLASVALTLTWAFFGTHIGAQAPGRAEFDVVSIKRVDEVRQSSGFRTLPDGSEVLLNMVVAGFVRQASPIKVREVLGLPEWASTERFDVTVKPPTGTTEEQRRAMWGAMFADRMKLVAHMEQRERTVYALVTARSDHRLGPELKPSTLDCTPRPESPPAANAPVRFQDFKSRCGYAMNGTSTMSIVSGGISMDQLALAVGGNVDADVENRTGLQGWYALSLTYAALVGGTQGDVPDVFTAIQEQLGLKLQPEKRMMSVFVIDHIERPSEN
jgi:uncharacterized protein (TIGR03435 family)